jgi:hypothetical protein
MSRHTLNRQGLEEPFLEQRVLEQSYLDNPFEGFRSIENKKFPTSTNKNKPRSDLRDAKQ